MDSQYFAPIPQGCKSAGVRCLLFGGCPEINFSNRALRVAVAATVGGTATKLSGGKFANGALTAAFSRAFNDEMHSASSRTQQSIRSYVKRLLRDAFVPDVTISTGGDITVVEGVGGKAGLGSYITTDGGDGLPDAGRYMTMGGAAGLDNDGALGFTVTFGGLENLQGSGQSIALDFGLFATDLNFNGDGSSFTGFTFSVSTPWYYQVSHGYTSTDTESYIH